MSYYFKKCTLGLFLVASLCATHNHAMQPTPVCIAPAFDFTFKCFVDKLFSIPILSAFLSTSIGFWCLKKSIEAYAGRKSATFSDGKLIQEDIMTNKAKNYFWAATALLGYSFFAWRHYLTHH